MHRETKNKDGVSLRLLHPLRSNQNDKRWTWQAHQISREDFRTSSEERFRRHHGNTRGTAPTTRSGRPQPCGEDLTTAEAMCRWEFAQWTCQDPMSLHHGLGNRFTETQSATSWS